MSNIDKEWLKQKIADMEAARDEILFGLDEDDSNTLAALRIALASLEAKSRKLFTCSGCGAEGLDEPLESKCHCNEDGAHWVESVVYTAPPAPVSVPEHIRRNDADGWLMYKGRRVGGGCAEWYNRALDDCRAAMLQGAEPVNQNDELPLDYLQGHKDGLEWSAQLAEANHPQTGDWLYDDPIELARAIRKGPDMPTAQDGNSPVTPDGWIPVSERMPNDKDFVWCWGYVSGWTESDGFEAYYDATRNKWWTIDDETVRKVTHWMPLPAAPLWE